MRVSVLGKYLRLPGMRFDAVTGALDAGPAGFRLVMQIAQTRWMPPRWCWHRSFQIIAMLAVMFHNSWRVTLAILLLGPPLALDHGQGKPFTAGSATASRKAARSTNTQAPRIRP